MLMVYSYSAEDGLSLRYGAITPSGLTPWSPEMPLPPDRPVLMFIPGLGGSVKGALTFLEHVVDVFPLILVPDLRGYGLNSQGPLAPSAKTHLRDLERFMDSIPGLTTHPQLHLGGISLGGSLSTHLANRYPHRFKSLLLLAPAYKASNVHFSSPYILKSCMGRLFHGKQFKTKLPYDIRAITRNPSVLADPHYQEMLPLTLTVDYLLQLRTLNEKACQGVKQLTMATMMVIPRLDTVCCPKTMEKAFGQIPPQVVKAKVTYPDLYHDVLLEPECPAIATAYGHWVQDHVLKLSNPQENPLTPMANG